MSTLPLFDLQEATSKFGSEQHAQSMQLAFLETLPAHKLELINNLDQNDITETRLLLHKMLGAAVYCGVPKLTFLLQKLQKEIHANSPDCLNNLDVLSLVACIEEMLNHA